MGIDAHRAATGQKPLFTGGDNDDGISTGGGTSGGTSGGNSGSDSTGGGGSGHHTITDNGVWNSRYCNKSIGITPPSKSEQFTR